MKRRIVQPDVRREVDEEFRHHFEMRVRDLVSEGWSEEDARREARRRFGDIERLKADCRELGTRRNVEMHRRQWWDELRQDLTFALRQLRRAPAFTILTVLTLGIAIGANTAVFSVVNAVLLAPLPFTEPDRLSILWTRYLPESGFDIDKFTLSGPEILDVRDESETLASVGVFQASSRTLTSEGADAERIRVGLYSSDVFPVLGVQPHLGRWFTPEEDVPDGPDVALLSYTTWSDRYGADPALIGRSVWMNGQSTRIVGVMPEGFEFPSETRAWLPLGLDRRNEGNRGGHSYTGIGRLADGMTQSDLDAELAVFRARWADEYEHNVGHFAWSQSLHDEVVADAPRALGLLMAAVGLILLVACVNVANLLLSRGERRSAEVALRRTLGAGRGRITRQLATESFVLAVLSAALGLVIARVGLTALMRAHATALPRLADVRLDATVLAYTLGITVVTAFLFGVVPAWLSGRRATKRAASGGSRGVGGSRRTSAIRRSFVTAEVSLSLVVVILAGLVVRSFLALAGTDPGMNPENVVTFAVTLPTSSYPNDAIVPMEYERARPGVTSATASTNLPFSGSGQWDFELDDRPARASGEVAWNTGISHVTTDYFQTLEIPVLEGRGLASSDLRGGQNVAVVTETMARRYWPDQDVIGKRFGFAQADTVPWITIVGVVPDHVTSRLSQDPYPHVYVPHPQGGLSTYFVPRSMQIAVRADGDPDAVLADLRGVVGTFDSDLAMYRVSTMDAVVASSFASTRVLTNLLMVFAVIALVLAIVGIYGVISYSVAGRTREIGVRVALGAERGTITRLILREGAQPVLLGAALGVLAALAASRLVRAMLFGVEATDPVTFTTLPLLLVLVGIAASLVPALRATRISPVEALRDE